jgi:hypothetical protein
MGDGNMGMEDYLRTYLAKCPGKPVSLEVIVQTGYRIFNYHDPAAWEIYKTTPAWEWVRFLSLAEKGTPQPLPDPPQRGAAGGGGRGGAQGRGGRGGGRGPQAPSPEVQQRILEDVETSVAWTQKFLATV